MIYTKKSAALFIIGLIMLAIWYLVSSNILASYIDHLEVKNINIIVSSPHYLFILEYSHSYLACGNG